MAVSLILIILVLIWVIFRKPKNTNATLSANKNKKLKQQPLTPRKVTPQTNIASNAPVSSYLTSHEEAVDPPEALKELKLITNSDICKTQQQATLFMMRKYKKPHPMLISLTKGQVSQQELLTIVKSDTKIAGRIIFIVNSPRFGVQQPIKDIYHAIMYLGLSEVKTIATELALKSSFDSGDAEHEQSFNNIWKASTLASSISLELGKAIGKDNASELSTLCLLSYLGDLILLSSNPESSFLYKKGSSFFQRVNDTQLKFKTNSPIIGSAAARAWELPNIMVKDIECSFAPLTNNQNISSLCDDEKLDIIICYLACRIAELAVFEQKSKIEDMNIFDQANCLHLEFFHLNSMLSIENMTHVKNLLSVNDFVHKANSLISRHVN